MFFINLSKKKLDKYTINKKGKHVFFLHNQSGKLEIEVTAQQAHVYIFGLFIGKKSDNFHLETIQHHRVGDSFSNLFIKGVFFDNSKFIYQGLIRIEKNAQKSHAYQKNQNLIMSKDCFVDSRPFLEILANDVFCTHGSTTGKLSEEQLYYLTTRGLTPVQAKKLLIEGFINDLFGKIEILGLKKEIKQLQTHPYA